MKRTSYQSGTPWEPIVGYSRAVRKGPFIFVTGTTATDEKGAIVGKGDAYLQTVQTFKNIQKALQALGGDLKDIVRTRMFVTDISQWQAIGRGHQEFMGSVMPATSMIEIKRLINPDMLVEIEADAIVDEP
ncbi:MAG: RidA family protein [Acidobacteria bacterium]|nr:RidA family protein [Acidobacteriota bacterium]MCB9397363.1 RidA family protein [Acidobacteriota bacterium]